MSSSAIPYPAKGKLFQIALFFSLLTALSTVSLQAQTPQSGQVAPDFTLQTTTGQSVRLSAQNAKGTTVLIFLRGYPGYQCPFCQKQAHDFITHATDFASKNANVLLVYPGPPAQLDDHAKEFLAKQSALPSNVTLVTDPDYRATNLYSLRWDAPNETAYPSTFILDRNRKILSEKISRAHGDRTTATDVLKEIPASN
jgi:peroxiredoxin Q/BCP